MTLLCGCFITFDLSVRRYDSTYNKFSQTKWIEKNIVTDFLKIQPIKTIQAIIYFLALYKLNLLSFLNDYVISTEVRLLFLGVYTRYKPFLNKDKTVLKRLAKVSYPTLVINTCTLESQNERGAPLFTCCFP